MGQPQPVPAPVATGVVIALPTAAPSRVIQGRKGGPYPKTVGNLTRYRGEKNYKAALVQKARARLDEVQRQAAFLADAIDHFQHELAQVMKS